MLHRKYGALSSICPLVLQHPGAVQLQDGRRVVCSGALGASWSSRDLIPGGVLALLAKRKNRKCVRSCFF